MAAKPRANGIDLDRLRSHSETIRTKSGGGVKVSRASVRWLGGFRHEVRVRDLDAIFADEPEALGGGNTAPTPGDQLLGALGSCLAIGWVAEASRRGIALNKLEVEVSGVIDSAVFLGLQDGYAGFSAINAIVRVDADVDGGLLNDVHASVIATSPVGSTLSRPVPVHIDLDSEMLNNGQAPA